MSSITATVDDRNQWTDGHKLHAAGYLTFTGSYAAGGLALDLGAAGVRSGAVPLFFVAPIYRGYNFEYVVGTTSADGKLVVRGTGGASATGTLTSDNTNVANNATVTIGTHVYTFKTTLTATTTADEVLIGTDADASLLNLIRAINGSGTAGTDYGSLTVVNTQVTAATSVTSHAFAVTAKVSGLAGNAIASTETSAHLSWGGTTLASGTDATIADAELSTAAFPTDLTTFQVPFYVILDQFV